ncbi:MAG TPA: FKBP-type peptidyl-prolyl cis-trans isomerase [Nitrososphaerales archaeon]|nr:FKBP-type peptidyl-prolyl cis-trans isomerase [Nitrososphaerales archaeon]
MTLENGALILADYTAKVKDTGLIIDTTRKEDAEKAGNADPTRTYEPRLIAVGEGWVLKGLDEALRKADANQTIDVELTPEKAFGVRDPNRVSRIPIKKFGEKAAELEIGAEIEVDNRVGIVRSIESGRVLIDFNHKYAGKTLQYNLEIKQKLDERSQQVEALIRRRLPIEKEKVKFEAVGESEVKVIIPNDYFLLDGLQIIKRGISTDLFKFIKPLDKVSFVEEYENPAKKEAEAKKQGEEKKEESKAEATPAPEAKSS